MGPHKRGSCDILFGVGLDDAQARSHMITHRIGQGGRYLWAKIVRAFAAAGINPNVLTAIGFGINVFAAYLFAYGYFRWAGAVVIVAAIFDLTDGPVARVTE